MVTLESTRTFTPKIIRSIRRPTQQPRWLFLIENVSAKVSFRDKPKPKLQSSPRAPRPPTFLFLIQSSIVKEQTSHKAMSKGQNPSGPNPTRVSLTRLSRNLRGKLIRASQQSQRQNPVPASGAPPSLMRRIYERVPRTVNTGG